MFLELTKLDHASGLGHRVEQQQLERSQTLVMESSPETSITQDFNPFVSTAAPQGMGATGLIYEPLHPVRPGQPVRSHYPGWPPPTRGVNGGKSITFAIRQGVKWNNGTALTPADVVFTYN